MCGEESSVVVVVVVAGALTVPASSRHVLDFDKYVN